MLGQVKLSAAFNISTFVGHFYLVLFEFGIIVILAMAALTEDRKAGHCRRILVLGLVKKVNTPTGRG